MNHMILDVYRKLSREAAQLSQKSGNQTLSARDVQSAAKILFPGEISKHAVSMGAEAVTKYL